MYRDLLDVFVLDEADADRAGNIQKLGMRVCTTNTVMDNLGIKRQLARQLLDLLTNLGHIEVRESGTTN